jgi:hypothetical protein
VQRGETITFAPSKMLWRLEVRPPIATLMKASDLSTSISLYESQPYLHGFHIKLTLALWASLLSTRMPFLIKELASHIYAGAMDLTELFQMIDERTSVMSPLIEANPVASLGTTFTFDDWSAENSNLNITDLNRAASKFNVLILPLLFHSK